MTTPDQAPPRKALRRLAIRAFAGLPWKADHRGFDVHKGRVWSAGSVLDRGAKVVVYAPTLERVREVVDAIEPALQRSERNDPPPLSQPDADALGDRP